MTENIAVNVFIVLVILCAVLIMGYKIAFWVLVKINNFQRARNLKDIDHE